VRRLLSRVVGRGLVAEAALLLARVELLVLRGMTGTLRRERDEARAEIAQLQARLDELLDELDGGGA
jgi:hypothetical protein